MKHLILLLAVSLVGCANSSGVHAIDADVYSVSVEASPAKGGIIYARKFAYEEAARKCGPLTVQRVSEVQPEQSWNVTMSRLTLDFRCVPST